MIEIHTFEEKNQKKSPYVITIHNESDQIKKAILFGGKEKMETANYGCDKGILVDSGIPNVTYLELLTQVLHKPIKDGVTKIYSTTQQLALPISYTHKSKQFKATTKPPIIVGFTNKEMIHEFMQTTISIDLQDINGCAETLMIGIID